MPTFDLDTLASASDHFLELFDLELQDLEVPGEPGVHHSCPLGSCVGTWTSDEPVYGRGLKPDNNDNSNSQQTSNKMDKDNDFAFNSKHAPNQASRTDKTR